MHKLQQSLSGPGYLLAGFRLITRPALWPFVLIPLAINISIFSLILWLLAGRFSSWVESFLPVLPESLSWLSWGLWLIFWLAAAITVLFTFTLVANLIAAPFNSLLAGAVEKQLTGTDADSSSILQTVYGLPGMLLDELRKILYFVLWAIPFGLLFLIPLVNLVAPLLWALFSAWILALQYLDYPLGNHGLKFSRQRRLIRSQTVLGMGFGGAILLATLLPVVNLFIIPAAVAGATRLWVERLQDRELS